MNNVIESEPTTKKGKDFYRQKFRAALSRGEFEKPERCESCGIKPDKSRLLQAHHHNGYLRWWDVKWLCMGCHRAADRDRIPRGDFNGMRKHPERSSFYKNNPKQKLPTGAIDQIVCELRAGFSTRSVITKYRITRPYLCIIRKKHGLSARIGRPQKNHQLLAAKNDPPKQPSKEGSGE